jgi:hypothetical protein
MMILVFHILVALSSVGYTGYAFIAPSERKIRASYALIALTLASGTYLVVSTHAHMLEACMTGLIYLGVVLSGVAAAQYRLARATR